jgi:hypothetical protein
MLGSPPGATWATAYRLDRSKPRLDQYREAEPARLVNPGQGPVGGIE